MEASKMITAVDYIGAIAKKKQLETMFNEVMNDLDLLLTPTLPALPKRIGEEEVKINGKVEPIFNCMVRYTSYFSLTGHPALSMPVGLSKERLPVGVQLVGNKWEEAKLLKIASTYESRHLSDYHTIEPGEQINL